MIKDGMREFSHTDRSPRKIGDSAHFCEPGWAMLRPFVAAGHAASAGGGACGKWGVAQRQILKLKERSFSCAVLRDRTNV